MGCTDDELFMRVKRLLTNHLHSKAAENIANSSNNSVTDTKYIEYGMHYSFYPVCWSIMNRPTNFLCVYKRLLANRLHGKAAELSLAQCENYKIHRVH